MELSIENKKKYILDKLLLNKNHTIDMNIDKLYNAIKTETPFEIESDNEYIWLGRYYFEIEEDYDKMKKYYLMASEKGDSDAMTNLGNYYETMEEDYDKMKKYYLMAIDKGDSNAMYYLGHYYENIERDYDQMKKYYLMAVDKGDIYAIDQLFEYYKNNHEDFKQHLIEYNSIKNENNSIKNEYNSIKNENEKLKKEIELLKLRPGGELYKEQEEKFNAVVME